MAMFRGHNSFIYKITPPPFTPFVRLIMLVSSAHCFQIGFPNDSSVLGLVRYTGSSPPLN